MSNSEMPLYVLKRSPCRQRWHIWKDSIRSYSQSIDSVWFFKIAPFSYACPHTSFQKEWYKFVALMCLEQLILSQFSVNEWWENLCRSYFYKECLIFFWSPPLAQHQRATWRKVATVTDWLKTCVAWIWPQ